MKKIFGVLGVAAVVAGCGSATLAELPDRELLVAQGASLHDPTEVLLQLGSGRTDGFCWTINDDLEATFNGRPMRVLQPGGVPQLFSSGCNPPQLSIQAEDSDAAAGETVIVVKDRSATLRARFAAYFTPRALQLVEPSGGVAPRGQNVTVAWTPASHRLEIACDDSGCDPVVAFAFTTASTTAWQIGDAAALSTVDNTLTVRIPSSAPVGEGDLILASRYSLRPQVLECDGAALCEAYWLNDAHTVPLSISVP